MPKASYQYGTSPRKYETEYTPRKTNKKTTNKKTDNKKTVNKKEGKETTKKTDVKKRIEERRAKQRQENKNRAIQIITVAFVFGMLLALSYREITIMEMFNQKKNLENRLSTIQKENGQIEKGIREEESKLDWNYISQTAKNQLGMQAKTAIPVDLEKTDNVETKNKYIKEEETNLIEDIIEYFIKNIEKNKGV